MITERTNPKGKVVLVVDLLFTHRDGSKERYRRDAKIQTSAGAKLEEQTILKQWFQDGTLKAVKPEPPPAPLKVNTFADALRHYRTHGLKYLKESSRRGFEAMYGGRRFERWMAWDVNQITATAIRAWQDEIIAGGHHKTVETKTISKSLMHQHRAAFMAVLRDVGPDEEGNPGVMLAALPKLPKMPRNLRPNRIIKAPPEDAVNKLLAAASPAVRFAFQISLWTGIRPCEVRALTRGQVNLDESVVTIDRAKNYGVVSTTKSGRERSFPIDPRLVPLLRDRLEQLQGDDDLVCVTAEGVPWSQDALAYQIKKLKLKLGLKEANLYGFRHRRGSDLGRVTDIKTVATILGHRYTATTERYISTDLDRMRLATLALAGVIDDQAAE